MAQSPAPGRQRRADICKFKPDLIANSRQAKVYNKTLTKKNKQKPKQNKKIQSQNQQQQQQKNKKLMLYQSISIYSE